MPESLKLTGINNPSLTVEFTDAITKTFDVWETGEKLNALVRDSEGLDADGKPKPYISIFDVTRLACGFRTAADAATSGDFTPNQQMCQMLRAKLDSIVEELPETKKLSKTPQK